jgi:hypothetical protein
MANFLSDIDNLIVKYLSVKVMWGQNKLGLLAWMAKIILSQFQIFSPWSYKD